MAEHIYKFDRDTYRQGMANLKLEGLRLKLSQHRLVMAYHSGVLSREEFIHKATEYARSR